MPKEPKALAIIKKKCTEEESKEIQKYFDDLKNTNIAILGEDEAFKLVDSKGEIRAFRSRVTLSSADGTLTQPIPGGPWVISAQGYGKINEATGAVVMNAPTVIVNGMPQKNPYVERDEKNGRILAIYCRSIAFRYSSKGIPQVSDRTTIFDIPSYRLIDLLAKAKKYPQAFRLLPQGKKPDEDGTWAQYNFDESTSLWVNTTHAEALSFYSQIINREKKAIDIAQTFSQRNASKHLHGLQKAPENKPVWAIPIICWRPLEGSIVKWDTARYFEAQETIAAIAEQKKAPGNGIKSIELTQGTDYVTEETPEIIDAEMEPEDKVGDAEKPPKATREDPDNPIWKQLEATHKSVPDVFQSALDLLDMDGLTINDITTIENVKKIMAKANKLADAA